MDLNNSERQFVCLVAIAVFLLSMPSCASISNSVPWNLGSGVARETTAESEIAQSPSEGTHVMWKQDANSTSDEWSYQNRNWLFGPRPSFLIYHQNGTELTEESYAQIGENLRFLVTVPKGVFTEGAGLSCVEMRGWYMSGSGNFSANFAFGLDVNMWKTGGWYAMSSQMNMSGYMGPPMLGFLEIMTSQCSNYSDLSNYYATLSVRFNSSVHVGLYSLDLGVRDTNYSWIQSVSSAMGSAFRAIAVGVPPVEAWRSSYGGSYTLQKLDLGGDTLYSISRNKDFVMRFNVSGQLPKYVELRFTLPSCIDATFNVTGRYWEWVTTFGGWVYQETLHTYVWNASAPVTVMKEMYGPHTERMSVPTETSELVYVPYLEYANESIVYVSLWVNKQMSFVYNFSTGDFETYYAYSYCGYPYSTYVPGIGNQEITVYQPIPTDMPILYELNATLCSTFNTRKEFTVDFVGHFTPLMPVSASGATFTFDDSVVGPDKEHYQPAIYGDGARQTQSEYQMARQIAIETPVTIAKLLDKNGKEPNGWMFQVDKGEEFMVQGRLQGGSAVSEDIDGVWFTLGAHSNHWGAEESSSTDVYYEVSYDMDGVPTFRAFNWTQKHNYTYGLHWDYVYANLTGWHYEYNSALSAWEWVYGEYWEWQWAQTEGWYWQNWYMNQLTGKWQIDWIAPISAETAVPANFCTTSGFAAYTKEEDLYASFLVTMSDSVSDTEYGWNFAFMNDTWYDDYSGDWGEHEVLSWEQQWVCSFDYDGDRVYFNQLSGNQRAYHNSTLCAMEGTNYLLGKETPYIVIDGQVLPVKVRVGSGFSSGGIHSYTLFWDNYNYSENRDYYHYELTNGTKVSVTYKPAAWVYNVTTITGDSFLTAMGGPDVWEYGGLLYYYWIDVQGVIHQGPQESYQNPIGFERLNRIVLDSQKPMWFIRYGLGDYLRIDDYWYQSIDSSYHMTDVDGNSYRLEDNGRGGLQTLIGGALYDVTFPQEYYTGSYEESDAMIVTLCFSQFWYAIIAGEEHEVPYVGANAEYWSDLDNTESNGGRLPTTKWVIFDGNEYLAYTFDEATYYSSILGTNYSLIPSNLPYWTANDTGIWDPFISAVSLDIGYFDSHLRFVRVERTDFMRGDPQWNPTNETYTFHLANGTVWTAVDSYALLVYECDLGGSTFYSTMSHPAPCSVDNYTYYYYLAINGSEIHVPTWEALPIVASFVVYTRPELASRVFDFLNETFPVYSYESFVTGYKVLDAAYPGVLFVSTQMGYQPVYQFSYRGTPVTAHTELEYVNKMRLVWGYPVVHGPRPISSTVYRNFQTLIIGVPAWGMWGIKNWVANPENGALDLDGDLESTGDEYFVQQLYNSTNVYSHEWNYMSVNLLWDPNETIFGDEMNINSWLGINTYAWSCEWSQTYYWYHASDSSQLSSGEMQAVKDILLTSEGEARPGYWDVAWMAKNVTWADIVAEAEARGWDWIKSNEQSWTWLSFGVSQDYGTSYTTGEVDHWLHVGMHYEFSGLMVWNDTNGNGLMEVNLINPSEGELSHYLIPDSVDSVEFVTPGMAYNDTLPSGSIHRATTDEITWGVTFCGINGTVFPFTVNGYWGWYDKSMTGVDLRTFDERPTKVRLDELSFLAHFSGHANSTSANSYATLKVDNYVGNWDLDIVGGRLNLEGRSLALNYFAQVNMGDFAFMANGTSASSEMTVSSETFDFETSGARFAQMIMGGTTYDWGKNTTAPCDVLSYTTPAGAFRTAYLSDSGKCAAAWSFTSAMFYLTIGFPEWEGYSVYQDPVFISYVSNRGTASGPGGVAFAALTMQPAIPTSSDSVTIAVDVSAVESINSVDLWYRTGTVWLVTSMSATGPNHYVGTIPPYATDVQVYYKIVVYTAAGQAESSVFSYIVGKGAVTTTTITQGPGEIMITLAILGAIAATGIAAVALLMRRKH